MTIRALRDDEELPPIEPHRYLNAAGYVRLRWLVGPDKYVEAYEHRVVAGRPIGLEVHHRNRVKTDNRPENLQSLTKAEHATLHQAEDAAKHAATLAARGGFRSRGAQEKAARAQARRNELTQRALRMRALYESGLSTTQIGAAVGIDSSNVSIHLRRVGTMMREFKRVAA
jgi:DNA-binding CsgD family transcriptional regulator